MLIDYKRYCVSIILHDVQDMQLLWAGFIFSFQFTETMSEFRKKYAKQRGYSVTVTPQQLVEIPLHLVSLINAGEHKSPVPSSQETLRISASFDHIEQVALNFDTLHSNVNILQIMPNGNCDRIFVVLSSI